jgi:hypothetical protein
MSNEIILCGDFNINYANDNSRKDRLNSLFASFNLFSTINFPTIISNKSCTSIDNIYININLYEFSVYLFINGLSDHDPQIITLKNITTSAPKQIYYIRRDVNNYTINQFLLQLSYENWEDVFSDTTANMTFNKFLNIFLRIFYTCFPLVKSLHSFRSKPWLTSGIYVWFAERTILLIIWRLDCLKPTIA